MADDFTDSPSTTGALAVGAASSGIFEMAGDHDWLRIDLAAGVTYQFSMAGAASGGGTLAGGTATARNAKLYVIGPDSPYSLITTELGAADFLPSLPFTATKSGTYYIGATSKVAGSYTISASVIGNDDIGASAATAGAIAINGSAHGVIGAINDRDWFKVSLTEGVPYVITLNDTDAATAGRLDAALYSRYSGFVDPVHRVEGAEYAAAGQYSISGTPTYSDDYYIQVSSWQALGSYSISVVQPGDQIGHTMGGSLALALGSSHNGAIEEAGDRDWFKIGLEAGGGYRFELDAASIAAGRTLSIGSGGSLTAYASGQLYVPGSAGMAYLQVTGAQAGEYAVSASALPDDFGSTAATAAVLGADASIVGRFDFAGDRDTVRMQVEAGRSYTVQLKFDSASSSGYVAGTTTAGTGVVLASASQYASGSAFAHNFRAQTSGEVVFNFTGRLEAGYTISSSVTARDEHGDTDATASVLAAGGSVSSALEVSLDKDVYKVRVQGGESYLVEVNSALGSALKVSLRDALNHNGLSGTSKYLYTPATTQDIYLTASTTGASGAYAILFGAAPDDYRGNAQTTAILSLGSTMSGSIDFRGDVDWIGVQLEAGKTYFYDGRFTSVNGASKPYLSIVDSSGARMAESYSSLSGGWETAGFVPATSGTYYMKLTSNHAYPTADFAKIGQYTLSMRLGVADDFITPRTVAPGETINGKFELASDVDTFRMEFQSNTYYSATVEQFNAAGARVSARSTSLSRADYYQGNMPTAGAIDDGYTYQAKVTGTFDMLVAAATGADHYTLRFEKIAVDDQPLAWSARELVLGQRMGGVFEARMDTDSFKVNVQAGQRLAFAVESAPSSFGEAGYVRGKPILGETDHYYYGEARKHFFDPLTGYRVVYTNPTAADKSYTFKIGNNLVGGYTFAAYDANLDQVAPHVLPPDLGAVSPGTRVSLAFSEAVMMGESEWLYLETAAGVRVDGIYAAKPGAISGGGANWHFDFGPNLMPGKEYALRYSGTTFYDLSGNAVPAGEHKFVAFASPGASAGDDVFAGLLNGTAIQGGAGVDTVVFDKYGSHMSLTNTGGVLKIVDRFGGSSAKFNTLEGIERLLFLQGTSAIALDASGVGGTAYRLYQAAFDRTPDQAGVGYWMSALEKGTSLREVAGYFVASAEFKTLYGANSSNLEFITRLYENVLNRPGEQAGIDYWLKALDAGYSREDTLINFSEGFENTAAVALVIGTGFPYIPYGG